MPTGRRALEWRTNEEWCFNSILEDSKQEQQPSSAAEGVARIQACTWSEPGNVEWRSLALMTDAQVGCDIGKGHWDKCVQGPSSHIPSPISPLLCLSVGGILKSTCPHLLQPPQ